MPIYAKEFVDDAEAKRLMGGAYDKGLVREARRAFGQSKRLAFYLLADAGTPRPLISKLCQVRPQQHVHNELNHRKREVTAVKERPVSGTERRFVEPSPPRRERSDEPSAARTSLSAPGRCLYLVSCVKTKRATPAAAKDMYISDWFRKARACVECGGGEWRILSAEYGAIHPDQEIRAYEKTLKNMHVGDRRKWARDVLDAIEPALDGTDTVVFLAGERYREFLEPALRERGITVDVPMRGLSQGRQLAWLNECLVRETNRSNG